MVLMKYLGEIKDIRGKQGRQYGLGDVLFCCLLALLSGAKSYREMHSFIKCHFDVLTNLLDVNWLRPPAYTTLRFIIHRADPKEIEKAFRAYSKNLSSEKSGIFIAGDGKTLRGSFDHMEDKKAIQLFSIFGLEDNLILAHEEVDNKTNEIPVFQKMLLNLGVQGKVFTLDALHAQKKL